MTDTLATDEFMAAFMNDVDRLTKEFIKRYGVQPNAIMVYTPIMRMVQQSEKTYGDYIFGYEMIGMTTPWDCQDITKMVMILKMNT